MGYLYRHVRKDTNEVFYIGISLLDDEKYKRAYSRGDRRNPLWKSIVAKTEYDVHIMMEGLSEEETKAKEIELILLYGRRDLGTGTLCNFTAGGDGSRGRVVTAEERIKMSERIKGELNHNWGKGKSKDVVEKWRKSHAWYRHSDETKRKMSGEFCYYSKLVLDKETGIFYTSSRDAFNELSLKMSERHFRAMLSGRYPNKTSCVRV